MRNNKAVRVWENGTKHCNWLQFIPRFHITIITNGLLLTVLLVFNAGFLYLLWLTAFFSTYMFFSGIRNLAEHAVVPDLFNPDPLLHTRTTLAHWWERLTFASNSVDYHLEHHLLLSIPKYRLAEFHAALKQRGLLDKADITVGYITLMRKLVVQPEAA